MIWVCQPCLEHKHGDCEGIDEKQQEPPFCECEVCIRRFERNLNRVNIKPGER